MKNLCGSFISKGMKLKLHSFRSLAFFLGLLFSVSCLPELNEVDSVRALAPSLLYDSKKASQNEPTAWVPLIIFVTATSVTGGMSGISGADSKCNTDSNKPNSSNYKAMVVDGMIRVACITPNCSGGLTEQSNWVLKPNQMYQRSDGTVIATTNADGIFDFSTALVNSISATSNIAWTGMSNDWVADSDNCNKWMNGTGIESGRNGQSNSTSNTAISYTLMSCNSMSVLLYCVEQ